jgi:hypothetical protein
VRELTAFISSVTVLAAAVVWLSQQIEERQDWRPAEYAKIANLRSMQLITKVRAEFGIPTAREPGPGGFVEEFFHRRTYWLDVIYESATGSVLSWVVTACGRDFTPEFDVAGDKRRLWETRMATVERGVLFPEARFWRAQTIHQPNELLEFGRLPGSLNFVGLVWGVADVCGAEFPAAADVVASSAPEGFMYDGGLSDCPNVFSHRPACGNQSLR